MQSIINESDIREEIEKGKEKVCIDELLEKSSESKGISSIEISALFHHLDKQHLKKARKIAETIRKKTKGLEATLYTCLYISNECINDCGYCGFRNSNDKLTRITLTSDQIREEAKVIRRSGHRNIILIGGTLPEESYKELILTGTQIALEEGLHPWIEFENLSSKTLRELHNVGANHFILFQETYDQIRYERIHKNSPLKKDYHARLQKTDEAIEAGFQNIGIGALFGLTSDYLFEILGVYHHTKHLQKQGADVCISIPALKPAPGLSISRPLYQMTEQDIERIVITLRLALPEISLALSGRETEALRNRLFDVVDHIGSGGVTNPGGRTIYKEEYQKGDKQFTLYDNRTPTEVTQYLKKTGIEIKSQLSWGTKSLPH